MRSACSVLLPNWQFNYIFNKNLFLERCCLLRFFHIVEHKRSDVHQELMRCQACTVAEKTAVKRDQWCQTRYQLIFIVRHTVYRNSLLLSASDLTCRISEYWCNVFCTFPRSSATSAAERFFDVSVVKALQSQAPFDCVKCAACSLLNIC